MCGRLPRMLPSKFLQSQTNHPSILFACRIFYTHDSTELTTSNELTDNTKPTDLTKLNRDRNEIKRINLDLNRQCHICKKRGHIAANCPRSRGICYNCGSLEHLSRECQEPKRCTVCGSQSHSANDCPTIVCFRCFERGHRMHQCTNDVICHKCGKPGHTARYCNVIEEKFMKIN